MLTLGDVVGDFARALEAVDQVAAAGGLGPWRDRHRGVGALHAENTMAAVLAEMARSDPKRYAHAGQFPYPNSSLTGDLRIPGSWAFAIRRVRAFANDGIRIRHWSADLLHPYAGPETAIGAAYQLVDSQLTERTALLLFGYEHIPAEVSLQRAAMAFEAVVRSVTTIQIGVRQTAETGLLVHPVHQRGVVYAWELSHE